MTGNQEKRRSCRNNIVLVGFMGSGKTTIGRELSKTLMMPRFDLDDLIEERERRTIPEIFAESGEAGYRKAETQVISSLVRSGAQGYIYSTGGGRRGLLRSGHAAVPGNLRL